MLVIAIFTLCSGSAIEFPSTAQLQIKMLAPTFWLVSCSAKSFLHKKTAKKQIRKLCHLYPLSPPPHSFPLRACLTRSLLAVGSCALAPASLPYSLPSSHPAVGTVRSLPTLFSGMYSDSYWKELCISAHSHLTRIEREWGEATCLF